MTVLLNEDGYHVLFVPTAQQALDILKTETPDVIIAEAEGSEISGNDLVRDRQDRRSGCATSR